MNKSRRRNSIAVFLGISIGVIAWVTIINRSVFIENPLAFKPLHSFASFLKDVERYGFTGNFLGNIGLFIPIGIFFPFVFCKRDSPRRKKCLQTILFGFSLSVLVELIQLVLHKGYFSIDDMILNTFGSAIGFTIDKLITRV